MKDPIRKGYGKRIIYNTGYILVICATLLLITAFVSPYWYVSWPRVYSPFKRIGLWEVCFAGLILERDPSQKAYHGCWWTLANEFKDIRSWMMPWWFVVNQIVTTIAVLVQLVNVILCTIVWIRTRPGKKEEKNPPIKKIQTVKIITLTTAIVLSIMYIFFGCFAIFDWYWMPFQFLNYLSWSYGLAVLSAFFYIFSSIALCVYTSIIKDEMKKPPANLPHEIHMSTYVA